MRELAQRCHKNQAEQIENKIILLTAILERPDMKAHQPAGRLTLIAARREQCELEKEMKAIAKMKYICN